MISLELVKIWSLSRWAARQFQGGTRPGGEIKKKRETIDSRLTLGSWQTQCSPSSNESQKNICRKKMIAWGKKKATATAKSGKEEGKDRGRRCSNCGIKTQVMGVEKTGQRSGTWWPESGRVKAVRSRAQLAYCILQLTWQGDVLSVGWGAGGVEKRAGGQRDWGVGGGKKGGQGVCAGNFSA